MKDKFEWVEVGFCGAHGYYKSGGGCPSCPAKKNFKFTKVQEEFLAKKPRFLFRGGTSGGGMAG